MKRRLLTVLLTAVFAGHAIGLSAAAHLATAHGPHADHAHGDVDHGGDDHAGAAELAPRPDTHQPSHDAAHCAVCHAIAVLKAPHLTQPAPIAALLLSPASHAPAQAHHLNSMALGTLGPRAPPAALL